MTPTRYRQQQQQSPPLDRCFDSRSLYMRKLNILEFKRRCHNSLSAQEMYIGVRHALRLSQRKTKSCLTNYNMHSLTNRAK